MGTNSPLLQARVIRQLEACDIEYAFVHGADEYAAGELLSDADIMTRRRPAQIVAELKTRLGEQGVVLAFLWQSDVGTLNCFWWDPDERAGCQIDLLFDSRGGNRFGFRTHQAWRHVDATVSPPRLSAPATTTYLRAKRAAKGQFEELQGLPWSSTHLDAELLALRARAALTVSRSRSLVHAYGLLTKMRSRALRLPSRLAIRQGVMIKVDLRAPGAAIVLSSLREVLPRVRVLSITKLRDKIRARVIPEVAVVDTPGGPTAEDMIADLEEFTQVALRRLLENSNDYE